MHVWNLEEFCMWVAFQAKYYVYCTHGDVSEYLISRNVLAMDQLYILLFSWQSYLKFGVHT